MNILLAIEAILGLVSQVWALISDLSDLTRRAQDEGRDISDAELAELRTRSEERVRAAIDKLRGA